MIKLIKHDKTTNGGTTTQVLDGFRDATGAVGGAVGASGSQGVLVRLPEMPQSILIGKTRSNHVKHC